MINVNEIYELTSDPPQQVEGVKAIAMHAEVKKEKCIIVQFNWEDSKNHNNFLTGSLTLTVPKDANHEIVRQKVLERIKLIGESKHENDENQKVEGSE